MQSNYSIYDYIKSVERIDSVIAESENSFKELNAIPPRSDLSFANGFYVNCSALFVDIRKSSQLPDEHYRPKLAKLYRAYISEVVAAMNGNANCAEISIAGDGVLGIFNSQYQSDINEVFSTAAIISSLIDILNYKLKKNDIKEIAVGIGMSYGRVLMIKAGFSGSKINDVVWMGDVVNEASKLASYGNIDYSNYEMMVSSVFYDNLSEENKKLLTWNNLKSCYHGYVINVAMNEWLKSQI